MIKTTEENDIGDEDIVIDDVIINYYQDADCCSNRDNTQQLKVFTENNGMARFLVLETERWAIDDIDELISILKDFKYRAGIIDEPKVPAEVLTPMGHIRIWTDGKPQSEIETLISNIGWVVGFDKDFKIRYHYSIDECKDILRRAGVEE